MTRKFPLVLGLGAAMLAAVAAFRFFAAGGVRPIEEYERVYYSPRSRWADFYLNRAPQESGWVHLPQSERRALFKSHVDPALKGFVRAEVCGECHEDKYQGLLETAHFRTSSEANLLTVLGEFGKEKGILKTRDPRLHFELACEDDGLYQRVVVEHDGKTYQHAERFDLVIGSGSHGQSYLYWRGDELYQLPVSYFSELGGWVNSPGFYRDGTADFARGVGHRCLDCHATFFAAAPGGDIRYDRERYLLGVTCVRCHGAGWAHVQYHRTHPEDGEPRYIVHPGKLPRDRANQVCAQCHSGVGRLLAPAFTYQPGDPLEAYLALDAAVDDPANDDPHAANQLARLMRSRCFQESENLTCADCHDPHRPERGDLKVFARRCAACHAPGDCKLAERHKGRFAHHCVECHMPSRRDLRGAMETREGKLLPLLRDHHIKVWPDVSRQVMKKILSEEAPPARR